jgi:hypothetical protein
MFIKIGSTRKNDRAFAINLANIISVSAFIDIVEVQDFDSDVITKAEVKMVSFKYITEHSPGSFPVDDETYDRVRKFIDNLPDLA